MRYCCGRMRVSGDFLLLLNDEALAAVVGVDEMDTLSIAGGRGIEGNFFVSVYAAKLVAARESPSSCVADATAIRNCTLDSTLLGKLRERVRYIGYVVRPRCVVAMVMVYDVATHSLVEEDA